MRNNFVVDETDLKKKNQDIFNLQSNTLAKRFASRRINSYSCISLEDAQKKLRI